MEQTAEYVEKTIDLGDHVGVHTINVDIIIDHLNENYKRDFGWGGQIENNRIRFLTGYHRCNSNESLLFEFQSGDNRNGVEGCKAYLTVSAPNENLVDEAIKSLIDRVEF